ncbi:hypothetical protein ABPG72_021067 [Tetrahymena utriculariae]
MLKSVLNAFLKNKIIKMSKDMFLLQSLIFGKKLVFTIKNQIGNVSGACRRKLIISLEINNYNNQQILNAVSFQQIQAEILNEGLDIYYLVLNSQSKISKTIAIHSQINRGILKRHQLDMDKQHQKGVQKQLKNECELILIIIVSKNQTICKQQEENE